MADVARDPALERPWIATTQQHVVIVIPFHEQHGATAKPLAYGARRMTEIGKHTHPTPVALDDELRRLAGVVRYRHPTNPHVRDLEIRVRTKRPDVEILPVPHAACGAERCVHGHSKPTRERADAVSVIGMFVRDENRRQIGWIDTQSPEARERVAQRESAID